MILKNTAVFVYLRLSFSNTVAGSEITHPLRDSLAQSRFDYSVRWNAYTFVQDHHSLSAGEPDLNEYLLCTLVSLFPRFHAPLYPGSKPC